MFFPEMENLIAGGKPLMRVERNFTDPPKSADFAKAMQEVTKDQAAPPVPQATVPAPPATVPPQVSLPEPPGTMAPPQATVPGPQPNVPAPEATIPGPQPAPQATVPAPQPTPPAAEANIPWPAAVSAPQAASGPAIAIPGLGAVPPPSTPPAVPPPATALPVPDGTFVLPPAAAPSPTSSLPAPFLAQALPPSIDSMADLAYAESLRRRMMELERMRGGEGYFGV